MRVGIGFDSHCLVEGRKLVLAGLEIPYPKGLLGHSDGDVVIHAVCDALLGAACLGDIGEHFPDESPAWAGMDSRSFLRECVARLREKGFKALSLDVTVVADAPRLAQWKPAMRESLARIVGLAAERVSVKAKTAEALNLSEGAVIAQAVVLLDESA